MDDIDDDVDYAAQHIRYQIDKTARFDRVYGISSANEASCRSAYAQMLLRAAKMLGAKTAEHHLHIRRTFNQQVRERMAAIQNPTPFQWVEHAAQVINEIQNEITYRRGASKSI